MRSMTAYGYSEYSCEDYILTMELKSYNNRFFEVSYAAPSVLSPYEPEITELIKNNAKRGHVDISIKLRNLKGTNEVSVDESAAHAYLAAFEKLNSLSSMHGFEPKLKFSDLSLQEGVISNTVIKSIDCYRTGLDACAKNVIEQFNIAKNREGKVTEKDLTEKINSIEKSLEVVKDNADGLESMIKENLVSRIHEMLGDQNYDENRILTEVAVMLMRYTINEETVRLGAHIAEFKKLLVSDEAVGKRMDFLCQEMNREINTIGSKSQMVNINFEVVNMKDCLENIREQIRNIE